MNKKIIRYSLSVIKKESLLQLGIAAGRCLNAPYIASLAVTERCNARCTTCDLWKNEQTDELSTSVWLEVLSQLKSLSRFCAINFTGGEPFVRNDFCDILAHANALGFYTTVTTNGIVFSDDQLDKIIKTGVNYINFSINSADPAIHDSYKGVAGVHKKIIDATCYIKRRYKQVRICFSPVITKDNYRTLNDFLIWAIKAGADIVDYIPILSSFGHNVRQDGPVSASASNPLLQIDDKEELDRQLDMLINKKRMGYPIVTPVYYLNKMKSYYHNPANVSFKKNCRIGLRNIHILPNGGVKLCYFFKEIGNLCEHPLKEIWFGKMANAQRHELAACRLPCMCSAFREYGLMDKISIFRLRY